MKKTVEYSYPSSTNAKRFGYDKTGCYTVSTINENYTKQKQLAAFATKAQAVTEAEKLPYEWHWMYLKYNP